MNAWAGKIALCGALGALLAAGFQADSPLSRALTRYVWLVLWSADFETGDITQWYLPAKSAGSNEGGGIFNSGLGSSVASTEYAHTGRWGLKMAITAPPESGTRMFRWRESRSIPDLYYTVWYYFPQNYSVPSYWNVLQWKSNNASGTTDPFFVLNVGNRPDGSMYFNLFDWQNRRTYLQSVVNIPVGRWIKVDAHYVCAPDNSGAVAIWQDGTALFDVTNVRTRYASGECHWSVDNYSDNIWPWPAVIYIDDAEIRSRHWLYPLPAPPGGMRKKLTSLKSRD
jgi:hypothetical protein